MIKHCLSCLLFFVLPGNIAICQEYIPIEYYSHIYLKGKLNDAAVSNFVFDTGAHVLYVDSCYYAESGLTFEKLGNAQLPGAGTGVQSAKVILDELSYTFSENTYKPKYGVLFHLRPILGDFADGIIGKDYFENQCIEINYKEKYIRKYAASSELDLTDFAKIQGKAIGEKIAFPITLKVTDDIIFTDYFLLDVGSGGTINLNSPIAQKYNLNDEIKQKVNFYTTQGGVGGSSESYTFILPELTIGGYTFKNIEADYSLNKTGALSSTKHAGLLGNEILERFTVIVDLKNSILYLKPNKDFDKTHNSMTFGFSFSNRFKMGYWQVNGFYRGFPAESSGMKIGDRIVEVNGIPVKDIYTFEKQREVMKSDTLSLKIDRGDSPLFVKVVKQNLFENVKN